MLFFLTLFDVLALADPDTTLARLAEAQAHSELFEMGAERRRACDVRNDNENYTDNPFDPEHQLHIAAPHDSCTNELYSQDGILYSWRCFCIHHYDDEYATSSGEMPICWTNGGPRSLKNKRWYKDHPNAVFCERRAVHDDSCMPFIAYTDETYDEQTGSQESAGCENTGKGCNFDERFMLTFCGADEICWSGAREVPYSSINPDLCRKRRCWCDSPGAEGSNNKIRCESPGATHQTDTYCPDNHFCWAPHHPEDPTQQGWFDFQLDGFSGGQWGGVCFDEDEEIVNRAEPVVIYEHEPLCPVPDWAFNQLDTWGWGRDCPQLADGSYDCLNQNWGYNTLEEAWRACPNVEGCDMIMGPYSVKKFDDDPTSIPNDADERAAKREYFNFHQGRYFLRRKSDPMTGGLMESDMVNTDGSTPVLGLGAVLSYNECITPFPTLNGHCQKGYPLDWCMNSDKARGWEPLEIWGQCGGGCEDYKAQVNCPPATTCYHKDAWYAQCLPTGTCDPANPWTSGWRCEAWEERPVEHVSDHCPNDPWQQCGGCGWEGPTCCSPSYECKKFTSTWSGCHPIEN